MNQHVTNVEFSLEFVGGIEIYVISVVVFLCARRGDVGAFEFVFMIARVQAEGTCWAGITVWQGRTAMRISVSSWATTDADVDRSVAAMVRVAAGTS